MSTLTKVFVVLLTVFSIAFTVMTVSIVAQTANWRETAQRYEQHATIADTNLKHLISVNAAELATAVDAAIHRLDQIEELETELKKYSNEVARREAELAKAASEKSSADAMNRGLVTQLQVAEAARAEYRTQRDGLEKQNIDLQRRNIDLNDRVNELTAQLAVLVEQKHQYEQQLNILKEENERLALTGRSTGGRRIAAVMEEPSGAAMTDVDAVTPVATTAIRASVVEVAGNLVTISVGSADGVKKDMVFVIHRGGNYVADLKVSMVDPNQSAGRLIRANFDPRVGDEVTDANGLGSARG